LEINQPQPHTIAVGLKFEVFFLRDDFIVVIASGNLLALFQQVA
jgi:hypothetical protein